MDTLVYADNQRMLRSDCMDGHADLDLHCLQIALVLFLCSLYDIAVIAADKAMGVARCGEGVVYHTSLGRPAEIGLQFIVGQGLLSL